MRLAAYKKSIDQARRLPKSIAELTRYFNVDYDPRYAAVSAILKTARQDEKLSDREFSELVRYADKTLYAGGGQ